MKAALILALFVISTPPAHAKKAATYLEVEAMNCSGESDSSKYVVSFDRRANAQQLAFKAINKANARDIKTQTLTVARWNYFPGDKGPHFAIKAKDGQNHWADFAVEADGVARERGNDIWWYTEAIPSSLIQFKCRFDEALRDKNEG